MLSSRIDPLQNTNNKCENLTVSEKANKKTVKTQWGNLHF